MTHPGVYVVSIGIAVGLAIYAYFATENRQEPHRYTPHPREEQYRPNNTNRRPETSRRRKPNDELDLCTICLDEVKNDWKKAELSCSHLFHHKCIVEWFKKNGISTCPNCKKETKIIIQ